MELIDFVREITDYFQEHNKKINVGYYGVQKKLYMAYMSNGDEAVLVNLEPYYSLKNEGINLQVITNMLSSVIHDIDVLNREVNMGVIDHSDFLYEKIKKEVKGYE